MRYGRRNLARVVLVVPVLLWGCGASAMMLQRSERIPAAEGSVKVDRGPNDNTRLKIEVKHLAPPDRIEAGANVFVAWARPLQGSNPPQNLGALVVDKDLSGRLETVTSWREFELIITAEPTAGGDRPTSAVLLSKDIRR